MSETVIDRTIVRAMIHPGIGVARLGNSRTGHFIGPETVTPAAREAGFYRDAKGALKRQAARFRVYGYNAAGEVVRELTADGDEVEWTVHLANRKADWYCVGPIDVMPGRSMPLRNLAVADRASLVIDPGPRSIAGRSQGGDAGHRFDTGKFRTVPVELGEVRTDEAGRLLVLGGFGVSASPDGAPVGFDDGWYDDISDGPVTARALIGGVALPVEPAWAVVAPPNYAPDIIGWRTMYDLQRGVFAEANLISSPDPVQFSRDILPLLQRMRGLQWLNKGFAGMFGAGGAIDFEDPALIDRLATGPVGPDDPWLELRRTVYNSFRIEGTEIPVRNANAPSLWPWFYSEFGHGMPLPDFQARLLDKWVQGNFVDDRGEALAIPTGVEALPLAQQPDMLDRAAMSYCLADAFNPGCEMTWPMRHASLYSEPFRIRLRPADQPEPSYGPELTPEMALSPEGPLGLQGQGPGCITRYMAVPWQADSITCLSGFDPAYDPYLPTFWPARVPNQVLDEADYLVAIDEGRPSSERIAAFQRRIDWLFSVFGQLSFADLAKAMIQHFDRLGIVEKRPGPKDDPIIPPEIYVSKACPVPKLLARAAAEMAASGETPAEGNLAKAGWRSEEHRRSFHAVRFRNLRQGGGRPGGALG